MRKYNIKDSIMMPPPKARPKSHSDTSEELRKNLMDCGGSSSCDNSFFQEELHKYFKENEESEFKRIDDELSISKSNESFLNEKSTNYYNSNNILNQINSPSINSLNNNLTVAENNFFNCNSSNNNNNFNNNNNNNNSNHNPNSIKPHVNSFNFNMVNYLYNDFSVSENNEESSQEYKKSIEKLKLNLAKDSMCYNKFLNLPTPSNNKEIKIFVENLEKYISEHLFDNSFKNLQIKLQTRYNDFRNKGLNFEYFKDTLEKMQKELISRICKQNNGERKIEIGNFC
jgi:hypothetical protein